MYSNQNPGLSSIRPNCQAQAQPTIEANRLALPSSAKYVNFVHQLAPPFIELFTEIFREEGLWSAFASGPSSVRGHHSKVDGNLLHCLEVAEICICLGELYDDVVDQDVLLSAALLHDIGKADEYENQLFGFRMSPVGKMIGHKMSGFAVVYSALRQVKGLTDAQIIGLKNCIACTSGFSHDIRGPGCFEAEILIKADQLSAAGDLYRKSYAARGGKAGFGLHHPHQRQTPFHIGGSLPPTPPTTPKSKSRFGYTSLKPRGAM